MRLVIIMAAILAGCAPAEPIPRPFPITAPSAGEGGAEVEKWNSYVDLANEMEALFLPALNAYLETFGHSLEYRPAEGSGLIANYFLVLMERPEEFSLVLDQARAAAGGREAELDLAVRELMPYLQEIWADLVRSRELHQGRQAAGTDATPETGELRGWLDELEEIHGRIFAAYQGFEATYEHFRGTLNRDGQERRQKDIQALKGKGQVIHPALLEILDTGQKLQDYLNVRHISGAPPARLKPEELEPFLNRLEKVAGILEAARAAGGNREGFSEEALIEFSDQLQAVRTEAAGLTGDGEGPKSSPETLARVLGRLVDIYNLMD